MFGTLHEFPNPWSLSETEADLPIPSEEVPSLKLDSLLVRFQPTCIFPYFGRSSPGLSTLVLGSVSSLTP